MAEKFFGSTDKGRLRDNNEDAFIAQDMFGGRMIAACVIDGVGGYEGGEVAAQIAKETILDHLSGEPADLLSQMRQALVLANDRIYEQRQKNPERDSMACVLTLVLADINNNDCVYAHIGDTRLYLFRDHSLVKLTKDHSFVGFLEDSRRISEKEAMRHPKRNEINKALGFDPHMGRQEDYIETGRSPFLPGDCLLLCSDGLTDLVDSEGITNILSGKGSLQQKTAALIDAANEAGGKDNITVVLVQNDKKPLSHQATKPVKKNDAAAKELIEKKSEASSVKNPTKKNAAVPVLLVICFLLLAAVGWLWWQGREKEQATPVPVDTRNSTEIGLANLITMTPDSLFVTDSLLKTVVLSDTLLIQKDSMYINGNGLLIRADSAYGGPGLFAPGAKFLMLENISFENFDVAILAPAQAIQFRNVRFVNCKTPLLAQYALPANIGVNGKLMDSLFYFTIDTTQKTGWHP